LNAVRRHRSRENGNGKRYAPPREEAAHLLESATDAFLGRILPAADGAAHFPEFLALKEPEQNGVAIGFAELGDGFVKERGNLAPRRIR
jgi:hypothetical protein